MLESMQFQHLRAPAELLQQLHHSQLGQMEVPSGINHLMDHKVSPAVVKQRLAECLLNAPLSLHQQLVFFPQLYPQFLHGGCICG